MFSPIRPPQVKETQMFQQAKAKLRSVLYLDVGAISPLPFGTDPNGNQLDFGIAEYKYTLLEFWASWCVPCREMNPAWNKLLADNEEKTLFQIIGVSIDEQTEHWKQAIEQDKLRNWKHISDLKGGFRGENGTRYALESIPFNILLDKEGRIVSKNIKPDILEKLLKDML